MYSIDKKSIAWRIVGEEVIILNLGNGHYYTLNDVGMVIWKGILQNHKPEILAEAVVETFEIDLKTAAKDVSDCIKHLVQEKIITYSS